MLKKLHSKAGMTLMEMMVSLLIMVLLVLAMGTGMNAGVRVYNDANFESNSASLAANINTALTDMLRYAQDIHEPETAEGATPVSSFVFTNLEYGLRDAYLSASDGVVKIISEKSGFQTKALVNSGSYNKLVIKDFSVTYYPEDATGTLATLEGSTTITRGGFFYVKYQIESPDGKTRDAEAVVRLMSK